MLALWIFIIVFCSLKYSKNGPRGGSGLKLKANTLCDTVTGIACLRRVARATRTSSFFGLDSRGRRARRRLPRLRRRR